MTERTKRLLFQFFFVTIALVIIELTLRAIGYKPGDIKPNWYNFTPVDTLYADPHFYTTQQGILVADSISHARDGVHINEEGFRSPDLNKTDTTKKKILLIGDSFTWGMSAKPLQNSFADILRNQSGYEIVNTGIPAADPVQYEQLTQKYVPVLKPNYVLIAFYMGNDLMRFDRPVIPGEPYCYFTNAGALFADIDGKHFKSVTDAYNFVTQKKYYLGNTDNIFEKIIAHSSLLSRLYSVKYRIEEKIQYEQTVKNASVTKKHLIEIQKICRQYNTPVRFVLIPEKKEADLPLKKYIDKYENLLLDETLNNSWITFENRSGNFNEYPDGHLNNAGHRFYADSIMAFLKTSPELK